MANFIALANGGFYDGLVFHRVIPGFMIQGGCPDGNGMGGPGYDIRGEFAGNGFAQNDLRHTTGVLSMARAMHPDSAGSQFFIMVAPAPHLDGQYAAFGQVTGNVEEAIRISEVPTDRNDKPKPPCRKNWRRRNRRWRSSSTTPAAVTWASGWGDGDRCPDPDGRSERPGHDGDDEPGHSPICRRGDASSTRLPSHPSAPRPG